MANKRETLKKINENSSLICLTNKRQPHIFTIYNNKKVQDMSVRGISIQNSTSFSRHPNVKLKLKLLNYIKNHNLALHFKIF